MLKKTIMLVILLLVALYGAALFGVGGQNKPTKPQVTEAGQKQPEQLHSSQPSAAKSLKPMPPCKEAVPGGPEEVIRKLYAAYPFGEGAVDNEPEQVLLGYFDANLTRHFLKVQQCFKNTGDICGTDVSLLYSAQDGVITDLKVCEMNSGTHVVDVQFRNMGDPQVVSYTLSNTNSGWRVADVIAHTDSGEFSQAEYFKHQDEESVASWKQAQADRLPVAPPKNAKPLPACEMAKGGGPEDLVRKLHDQYPWKEDRIIIDEPKNVLLTFFDESLSNVIVKHHEKAGDGFLGMPNIIVNHDEVESLNVISGFHICTMDAASKTVRVQFYDDGSPKVVAYILSSTKAGWRISDIRLLSGKGKSEGDYDWSLLEGLSGD